MGSESVAPTSKSSVAFSKTSRAICSEAFELESELDDEDDEGEPLFPSLPASFPDSSLFGFFTGATM
jgi:hypothetical protein